MKRPAEAARSEALSSHGIFAALLGSCLALTMPAALAAGSPAAQAATAPSVNVRDVAPSPAMPSGTNIAALDQGGEVESVTGSYGPGHAGRLLIDGLQQPTWTPEVDGLYPQEVVLSFYGHEAALVAAVTFSFPAEVASRPKDIEIAVSMNSPVDGFTSIAKASLDEAYPVQTISFAPIAGPLLEDPAAVGNGIRATSDRRDRNL